MALVCEEIQEWIQEEITKPVERWVEKAERVCKDWPWPLDWLCKTVVSLVKVVVWVTDIVSRLVVRTVCKFVAIVVEFLIGIISGLWDIIAGIFTGDWRRILDGLIRIGISIVVAVVGAASILFFGDAIDFLKSEYEKGQLRDHVRKLLEAKYSGDELDDIKDNLRVDFGAFGFRIRMTAIRTFLDSETRLNDQSVPNLVLLHETGRINLPELAGFQFTEGFSNRKRYKTIKKETVLTGGGGLGEFENPISEDELNEYLTTRGAEGPKFIILAMKDGVLETKLTAAQETGRQLGLMISWEQQKTEVRANNDIVHRGFDTGVADSALVSFLSSVIGRTNDPQELCNPVAVGVFRYTDTLRGISACLKGSTGDEKCQPQHDASGVTFIDNFPDEIWKYVPIHELGHFFGLCHVDGVDRIMYSAKQNSWFSWTTLPNMLYLRGMKPKFVLDEAKQTWDYIVANYPANCLK